MYSRTEESKENRKSYGLFNFKFLLLVIFLALAVYSVFFSPLFKINKVNVSETKFVSREEVEQRIASNNNILNKNVVTFGFYGTTSDLKKITGIKSIKFNRISFHEIEISIIEESPILVWQTLDHKYLVNAGGVAWADYQDKYVALPHVIDTKNLPVTLGTRLLPDSFCDFFNELGIRFADSTGSKITKIEVLDIVSDLRVTTDAGWYVVFDTSRTANNQLVSLKRVLEEARIKNKKLEYIDLRIDNRVFYK